VPFSSEKPVRTGFLFDISLLLSFHVSLSI
jgi:hypothetical protein